MQKYEKPLCEVVVFENLDIIRTSLTDEDWIYDQDFGQK